MKNGLAPGSKANALRQRFREGDRRGGAAESSVSFSFREKQTRLAENAASEGVTE